MLLYENVVRIKIVGTQTDYDLLTTPLSNIFDTFDFFRVYNKFLGFKKFKILKFIKTSSFNFSCKHNNPESSRYLSIFTLALISL